MDELLLVAMYGNKLPHQGEMNIPFSEEKVHISCEFGLPGSSSFVCPTLDGSDAVLIPKEINFIGLYKLLPHLCNFVFCFNYKNYTAKVSEGCANITLNT